MKLPQLKIKYKFRLQLMINLLLVLIILSHLYFAYTLLYRKLNAQPTEVILTRIVKVDLNAYRKTTDLINNLKNFVPGPLLLENSNPFKYK